MELPRLFLERMKNLLPPEEYEAFVASYDRPTSPGLRLNTRKISREDGLRLLPFALSPVPWAENGFSYSPEEHPGRHPYHEAGLYYIQEPSAMVAAAVGGARPGERVLDLCAAPGGKATELACGLRGQGLLVANEIHPARAKILSQNVERMGIGNAVVTNETPQSLAARFPGYFDRVLVDAPCSGEGMFRKEEQALVHWSPENVAMCAERQTDILEEAARLLAPGGWLIYSTCTFAPDENEGSMARLLEAHPELTLVDAEMLGRLRPEKAALCESLAPGQPEWVQGPECLRGSFRLWPHRLRGEGHYLALLKKEGETRPLPPAGKLPPVARVVREAWEAFAGETLARRPEGELLLFGEQLYLLPEAIPLRGLRVLRPGLHLGTWKKDRLTPSHALALWLSAEDARRVLPLSAEDGSAARYLRGETLPCEGENGWTLVLVDGYSLGWGKVSGGILKNHYPKGLRRG